MNLICSKPLFKNTIENAKFGNVKLPIPRSISFRYNFPDIGTRYNHYKKCNYICGITFNDCLLDEKMCKYMLTTHTLKFDTVFFERDLEMNWIEATRTKYKTKKCLLNCVIMPEELFFEQIPQMDLFFRILKPFIATLI